ncbi:hypothetical protein [Caulobacter sp. 17J65-9]|uniref:hypothetical protein n=1 Tax=Caulobacter sp. 17J65-9 TaxID=2709382 RepID=UPI0013C8798D|nr:hypothetical protein [Caulobacter sp. 17J65-9]NEX93314.1 hypothetical protein [Caulobacter sp. 17J65-9]
MISDLVLNAFTWTCWLAALGAVGAYAYSFIKHRPHSRLWNSAGLLLTGIALTQVPLFLREGAAGPGPGGLHAGLAIGFLSLAVLLQAVTALRRRKRAT